MKMLKIWTMLIVLLAAFEVRAASVYVRDIKVEGLERVEVETVLSYVDIKKNTIIDDAKMDASLKQLYATGLFNDVSLNMKNDGLLIIKVAENPIINKVLFDGNDKVDDEMLKGELQLAPGRLILAPKFRKMFSVSLKFTNVPGVMP
ncbi:MAG: POTRA domain-containing protein [Alphaproteobacteria bacterium]